jgi:hypothetical protein
VPHTPLTPQSWGGGWDAGHVGLGGVRGGGGMDAGHVTRVPGPATRYHAPLLSHVTLATPPHLPGCGRVVADGGRDRGCGRDQGHDYDHGHGLDHGCGPVGAA